MSDAFGAFLNQSVEQGVFPGVAVCVGRSGAILYEAGHGTLSPENGLRVSPETLFDIASLTKVLVTGALCAQAVDEGIFQLDDKIGPFCIRHLLCHASGLPAWKPFYEKIPEHTGVAKTKALYREWILGEKLEAPAGQKACYSDLGFILLGIYLEERFAVNLAALARKKIFDPLKLNATTYGPVAGKNIAPTEECPFRKRIIRGEVHDLNALALGGIAGHAGVFSSVRDIGLFAQTMLRNLAGEEIFVSPKTLKSFCQPQHLPKDSTWALAWDTPSPKDSTAGTLWSKTGLGHLGFTGCSLWLDPEKDFFVACLSNRVHPDVNNQKIKAFRPALHDQAVQLFREGKGKKGKAS